MGRYRSKRPYPKKAKRKHEREGAESGQVSSNGVPFDLVAEFIVDLWKIERRVRAGNAGERILAACERAQERLIRIGFELDTMMNRPYNENLRMRIIEHEECDEPRQVAECLSPAVYYNGELVREAEVVTRGK
ncbi:MAG: hypothetical protein QY327_01470 [Fimbriimonadaceae bacterium]|nr:MAG: hypothetical protein UZ18_ATM001002069 [Armatimonadetes bacterium OLB18]WKZ80570.1 MAG: hypothetical protein QY327_01470 [Fimbriimonadaceae bacterium]